MPRSEEISAFGHETPCFGNFDRKVEFMASDHRATEDWLGRPILSGHHFERALDCPAVLAVQRDPLLSEIARRYLGAQAQLITTRTWWSFPTKASEADRSLASLDKYHFDLDDWRMMKFFFYLVDVDAGTGPHVYVRGSHNKRRMKHQLTLLVGHPADEIVDYYGKDSPITLTGKAGSGFVEDPFGFHMGTVATERAAADDGGRLRRLQALTSPLPRRAGAALSRAAGITHIANHTEIPYGRRHDDRQVRSRQGRGQSRKAQAVTGLR
jgi:hypothetical protein